MTNKIFFLTVIVCFFTMTNFVIAQSEGGSGPQLAFEKERKDIGTMSLDEMPEGNNFELDINFTNTGDAPLIISNVRACCGTRVQEWPQEPIAPEGEGTIKVSFRLAPRAQRVSRTVTVTYNNESQPTIIQRIVGEILEEEEEETEESEFLQKIE